MNRRIKGQIFTHMRDDSPAWRVVSAVLIFLAALAIAALLSIDDVEGPRRVAPEFAP